MSTSDAGAEPRGTPDGGSSYRTWAIVATIVAVVAAAAALGLGIWAATLNSDLDDANAHSARAQQVYEQALGATTDQLAVQSSQLDKAAAALESAVQALEQAASDQEKQQAEGQYASALAENATVCTKGALSALDRLFSGPSVNTALERAAEDVQTVAARCKAALEASG